MTGPSRPDKKGKGKLIPLRGRARSDPLSDPRRRGRGVFIREPSDQPLPTARSGPPLPSPTHAPSDPSVSFFIPTPRFPPQTHGVQQHSPLDLDETEPPSDYDGGDDEHLDDVEMDMEEEQEQAQTAADGRTIIRPFGSELVKNLFQLVITT